MKTIRGNHVLQLSPAQSKAGLPCRHRELYKYPYIPLGPRAHSTAVGKESAGSDFQVSQQLKL